MASSEMHDRDSELTPERGAGPESGPTETPAGEVRSEEDRAARRFTSSRVIGAADRERLLHEARDIDFPIALRGYDRGAVDRYIERVTRLITELEMSSSPEAAVRHALDEVSEETRDILQRAHQTADEITLRSRSKADERLQQVEHEAQSTRDAARRDAQELTEGAAREAHDLRATSQREADELRDTTLRELAELRETAARETQQLRAAAQREADDARNSARREADEMLEQAETRARDLGRNAETIWRERRRLIDDMRAVGEQLIAIGEVEEKRFPRPAEELALSGEQSAQQTPPTISEASRPEDGGGSAAGHTPTPGARV